MSDQLSSKSSDSRIGKNFPQNALLKIFTWPIRVYVEDTDAGGIVFYANYLKYFERARTEFIRAAGFEWRHGFADNISYVVHSLDIKYLKSARLDDSIRVTVELKKMGKTYLLFKQQVINEAGELLVEGNVKIACVHLETSKPRVLPAEMVEKLSIKNHS